MSAPPPFDARLLRAHKARAARGFADAAFLHQRAADDLAERLEAIPRAFTRSLLLGAPDLMRAVIAARPDLQARLGQIIAADIAPNANAHVVVDLEKLPFPDASLDLVLSPLALHWVSDLPGAFIQIRRALRPDGLMLASLLGGETLTELRLSLIEAETDVTGGAGPRVAPFAQLYDIASLLQRAGFALPAADKERVIVRYREPMRLFADLRAMGETSALAQRPPTSLSRRILARALEIYTERFADPDGRIRATFDILTAAGWAPDASQQQPLKPGSAKTRLAEALGVSEQPAGDKAGR